MSQAAKSVLNRDFLSLVGELESDAKENSTAARGQHDIPVLCDPRAEIQIVDGIDCVVDLNLHTATVGVTSPTKAAAECARRAAGGRNVLSDAIGRGHILKCAHAHARLELTRDLTLDVVEQIAGGHNAGLCGAAREAHRRHQAGNVGGEIKLTEGEITACNGAKRAGAWRACRLVEEVAGRIGCAARRNRRVESDVQRGLGRIANPVFRGACAEEERVGDAVAGLAAQILARTPQVPNKRRVLWVRVLTAWLRGVSSQRAVAVAACA